MTTRANTTRRPTTTVLVVLGLLLTAALSANAVPLIESTYGGQSPWFTAELNSQSVTGVAEYRGGMNTILNPAGLALAEGLRVDLGINANYHEEDRFVPLYDSFQSLVDDISIASNQNTWWGYGFALAAQLDPDPLPVCIGLSLADRYPFAYRFDEELRDPDVFNQPRDRILEERTYEVTGTLRQLSLGLGLGPTEWLDFGASIHYAFGDRNERWTVRDNDLDDGDQSYEDRTSWDLDGLNASFGLQGRVHERVRLGVAYETRLIVDGNYTLSTFDAGDEAPAEFPERQSLRYPDYWRFGGTFYPRSDPRTVFTLDVVYADWSKLEDSRSHDEAPFLQDVWDVRLGLQHTFYNGTDLRFGFRRYDSYADENGGNSVFAGGVGFPVVDGQLSFSLELNKLQSIQEHIFGYPEDGDFVVEDTARVDDLRVRLGLGWTREF